MSLFFLLVHSRALTITRAPKGRKAPPAPGPSQGTHSTSTEHLCAARGQQEQAQEPGLQLQ